MRLTRTQEGSIPLALLASIVTAGLITALVATVIQSERTVRFDRSFTTVVQAADAGVQEAYHMLSSDLLDMEVSDPPEGRTGTSNGMAYEWEIDRLDVRSFEVVSTGTAQDGTSRTVVARIEKDALFFPGAFGDQLVGLQGNSTHIDSYESATSGCSTNTDPVLCWGDDPNNDPYGTGKAALGTNGDFVFKGNSESIRRAVLYDWAENPPADGTVTPTNPGGSRCDDAGAVNKQPCTHDVLRMDDEPLEYGTDTEMAFIQHKLDTCAEDQWLRNSGMPGVDRGAEVTYLGEKNGAPAELSPYSTMTVDNEGSPADEGWKNYWCADSIQVLGHVELVGASPQTPVVLFVQDSYSQGSQQQVNWPGDRQTNFTQMSTTSGWRSERPTASTLQLYIASDVPHGSTANVSIANQAVFSGVVYAPRSICSGASSNAAANIYGALICRTISNVGNWKFHYDEVLGDITRDTYTVATWREEAPAP